MALSLHTVNAPPPPNGLALYNAYIGPETPLDSGVIELIVRPLGHVMVGDRVSGIVQSVDTAAAGVALASELVVLSARGSTAAQLRAAGSGDTVQWLLSFPTAGERIRELIGGFPPLLRSGRTFYRDEYDLLTSFSEGRHPRSAIGWRADGTLLILTVDGRQPGYSEGMTLEELASYMQTLGAREALNLDGGGSTTLVLSGRVVNRPSDAEGERAVANALLVLGPLPGAC